MITQKVIRAQSFTNSFGYGYDSLHRLTSETVGGTTKTCGYDLAGNRTNITVGGAATNYQYGIGNRLSSWTGSGQYKHNSAGCVTNIVRAGGRTLRLEWDSQYWVKAVYTNNVLAERYGYDALGRRAWIGTATTTNKLVYDGLDLVAMTDAAGNLQRTWLHGPGIDDVLSMTVYGAQTNTYTYIKDHQNTVLALVNDSGVVIERYDYDAWGNTVVRDGSGNALAASAYGNPFTFQGREISWATGLINFRARWYDLETGLWLSNDPIGISGGLNQYAFCSDNPILFNDPEGLTWESNWNYFWSWAFGTGETKRFYNHDSVELNEMKNSPGANKLRNWFYEKGCINNIGFVYNTREAARDTLLSPSQWCSTALQVGGFNAEAKNNQNGTVTFKIENKAGTKSFFYHLVPDRKSASGFGRSIYQTFEWTEQIKRKPTRDIGVELGMHICHLFNIPANMGATNENK